MFIVLIQRVLLFVIAKYCFFNTFGTEDENGNNNINSSFLFSL